MFDIEEMLVIGKILIICNKGRHLDIYIGNNMPHQGSLHSKQPIIKSNCHLF